MMRDAQRGLERNTSMDDRWLRAARVAVYCALALVLGRPAASGAAAAAECATAETPRPVPLPLGDAPLETPGRLGLELGSFAINIVAGPTLQGNAAALAAFNRAANQWKAFISDPV